MVGKYTIYFANEVTDIAYDYCMYYIRRGDIVNSLKLAKYALIVTKLVEQISGVKIRRIYNIK